MSYNVHKQQALDTSRPMKHRMSHARSLCVITAVRHGVRREAVIDRVRELTGLNLHEVLSEEAIQTAIRCLDSLRKRYPEVSELDEPLPDEPRP